VNPDTPPSSLATALRRNRGRALVQPYLTRVSQVLGRSLSAEHDLVPLEETDLLFERYTAAFRSAVAGTVSSSHHVIATPDSGELLASMTPLAETTCGPMFLFGASFDVVGALRVDAAELFGKMAQLFELEGGELRACSGSATPGFLVDSLERERQVEIWVWGTR